MEARFAEVPTIPSKLGLNHGVIGDRRLQALSTMGRRDLEAWIGGIPAQKRVSGARSLTSGIFCEMGRLRSLKVLFLYR